MSPSNDQTRSDLHVSRPPLPLTPLIGRDVEVALALGLLNQPEVRLLTITGAGGIGKTRLALQIASELAAGPGREVCFVSLASIAGTEAVAGAISRALGLSQQRDAAGPDTLFAAIGRSRLTLVLDNFEHLLPSAPLISDLLASCDGLTCIVTSRAILRVSGEHVIPLPPLALPDDRAGDFNADDARQSPAVRLFVERARAVTGGFALTPENTRLIVEICRRLDGLPLAIELAAARVSHLPLATMRDRLDRRFAVLVGGPQDRPPRLRTIRAAMAWSYDLLDPAEQALLRALAVCVGGFTLDTAESFAAGAPDLLERLSSLVDKSLVIHHDALKPSSRYQMLDTIREFGLEASRQTGEYASTRDAHAAYYLRLAEQLEATSPRREEDQALHLLELEYANLIEALGWLRDQRNPDRLMRLVSALAWFWFAHSHYRDGRSWLEQALTDDAGASVESRAGALTGLALIASFQGDQERALPACEQGLALFEQAGHQAGMARARIGLGVIANHRERSDEAAAHFEESLALTARLDDRVIADSIASDAFANLGVTRQAQGRMSDASECHERALMLRRQLGHWWGISRSLRDQGDVARAQDRHADAMARYRESLEIALDLGDRRIAADVLEGIGLSAIAWRQTAIGVRLLAAAERERQRIGIVISLQHEGTPRSAAISHARARLGEPAFGSAWRSGQSWAIARAAAEIDAIVPGTPGPSPVGGAKLTRRESELLPLIAAGYTDPEIAALLFLSVRTVENHVARILAKLGIKTRTAAAGFAVRTSLISPQPPITRHHLDSG